MIIAHGNGFRGFFSPRRIPLRDIRPCSIDPRQTERERERERLDENLRSFEEIFDHPSNELPFRILRYNRTEETEYSLSRGIKIREKYDGPFESKIQPRGKDGAWLFLRMYVRALETIGWLRSPADN